jgi:hypothetical protein
VSTWSSKASSPHPSQLAWPHDNNDQPRPSQHTTRGVINMATQFPSYLARLSIDYPSTILARRDVTS